MIGVEAAKCFILRLISGWNKSPCWSWLPQDTLGSFSHAYSTHTLLVKAQQCWVQDLNNGVNSCPFKILWKLLTVAHLPVCLSAAGDALHCHSGESVLVPCQLQQLYLFIGSNFYTSYWSVCCSGHSEYENFIWLFVLKSFWAWQVIFYVLKAANKVGCSETKSINYLISLTH